MNPLSVISRHTMDAGTECSLNNALMASGRSRFIRSRAEMLTDTCSCKPSRRHTPHCRIASASTQRVSTLM
jgi:hypothetical protein